MPFALVGCEIGYGQLGATRFFGYSPSRIQRIFKEYFLFRPTSYKTSPLRSFLQWHVFRKVLNQPNLG